MERGIEKGKAARKRLFALVLTLAMVFTSVSVPSVTAEAAKNVKVKKIQITNPKKKKVTLVKGKTLQIKVKVTPKNAKNKKVTYKSSKKKIASVSKKGKVKGLKKGTAKITVTAKDGSKKKATLTVKVVNPVKVTKVTVSPAAATVDAGKTVALKATCAPKNATNKAVSWKTSDKGVATVNAQGVVTGVKAGTAKITATAKDGSKKSGSCTVTVKAAAVAPNPNPPAPTVKTLEGIAVTKAPAKTAYYKDEKFDPAGMEVTASYSDKSSKALAANEYTLDPSVDTPLKTTHNVVTVSYTEGGVTKTATTPITVETAPKVTGISIKQLPDKTEYMEGDVFNPAGMVVEAKMNKGPAKILGEGEYTYSTEPLEVTAGAEKTKFVISYSETITAEVEILVRAEHELTAIEVELLKTTLPRKGGHFQEGDIKVMASFKDIAEKKQIPVADCIVVPDAFELTTTSATVNYWYGGVKKFQEVTGFTVTEYEQGYTFDDASRIGTVVKRVNDGNELEPTTEGAASIEIPETAFVNGINGKALKMDGTYGLRLDDIAGTDSESYSLSMWVKPDSLKNCQALAISTSSKFGLADAGQETWCAVAGDNDGEGSIKLWSRDTVGLVEDHKQGKIPVGEDAEWSHIVLVVDGTTTKAGTAPEEGSPRSLGTLYVNGKKIYSADIANEKLNGRGPQLKTYIGVTAWKVDGYYAGLIDELVFTNEVMTDADVEKAYLDGLESSGNAVSKITSVSPDDGKEIEIKYGTSLSDLKAELVKIAYTAKAEGKEEAISLPTTSEMWTVDNYTVTSEGTVEATVTLQAPNGSLFNLDGNLSTTLERKVAVKIKAPVVISKVEPSETSITVPFGTSEDSIKEALAELTFAVTTSDSSVYEIVNAKSLWTLTADGNNYKAAFNLKTPKPGYKYADNVKVEVAVIVQQPITITALTATPATLSVIYNTSEADLKDKLAELTIAATVAEGSDAPASIANTADMWTIANYAATTPGEYTAKATVTAPVGYKFADGVGEVSVTVTVKEQGTHKLSEIKVTTKPKVKYIVGDDFDKTGMVVTAYYEDGQSAPVTDKATVAEATNLALGEKEIEISYSEGQGAEAITATCKLNINTVKVEDGAAAHYGFEESLENSVDTTKKAKVVEDVELTDSTEEPNYQEGIKGQGILFNEGEQRTGIELAESIAAEQKNFTLNLWVNLKSEPTQWGEVVLGTKAKWDKQLVMYANPGGASGALEAQSPIIPVPAGKDDPKINEHRFQNALIKGQWRMLTWVNSDTGMKFYIDGQEQTVAKDLAIKEGIQRIVLGAGWWADYFHGSMDEVSIYDCSLKKSQVEALYNTVTPTISGFSVDAKAEDFTFLKADVESDQKPIQDALKKLKINVTMKNGAAPEIENTTDWNLVKSANGYTATKEIAAPAGYKIAANTKTTLTVNVIVKDIQLTSIEITKQPTKVNYTAGEAFDPTGMVVTANYNDKSKKDVTKAVEITAGGTAVTPEDGTAVTGEQNVTFSYTEGGITETATQKITVINPSTPKGAMLAARTAYYTFDGTLADSVKNNTVGKTVKLTGYNAYADTNLTDIYSDAAGDFVKGKSLAVKKDVAVEIPESISKENREFTINLWVKKKDGTSNYGAIFHGKNEIDGFGKCLVMYANPYDAGKMELQTNGGGIAEKFDLANDAWTMLTFVNTKDSMEFYINGTAVELTKERKGEFSIKNEISRMLLGVGQWNVDDAFVGNIDEVSIYNAALTPQQVTLLKEEVAGQ